MTTKPSAVEITKKPSAEEIKEALDAIHKLCLFDGQQRMIRGYGAFKKEEIPVKGLVKLIAWLEININE